MGERAEDGGPIHPIPEVRDVDGNGIMAGWNGMSLRDWFAGQATMPPDGVSETWATAIMGREPPDWLLDDKLTCVKWWAEAEARARYISADAMLKARSPSQESSRG